MHAPALPTFWQPERVRVALPFDRGPSFAAAREPSTSPRSVGTEPRTLHRDQLETGTMQLTHSVGHGQCPQPVHARHPLPGLPILQSWTESPRFLTWLQWPQAKPRLSNSPLCAGHGTASTKLRTLCTDCVRLTTLPYLRTVAIEPA
ncbi:hypothetical protein GRF29_19g104822 [Pseudopithomyces chartarum]|uniref:Uncharacterized protein n=1 Tax=Pseudopithomyces chartarum TaxID=1892770 RepID=A0AAN6RJ83_9PLEO|nr:hypothetical protein GRF29_19g104822 [Pseudopithomyces chartarum]